MEFKGVLSKGVYKILVGNRVGVGLTRSTINPMQVHYVRMTVSPLLRGPGNIHGSILDGKATAQTPTVLAVSGVRITTLPLRT